VCPGGNRIWPLPGWYGVRTRVDVLLTGRRWNYGEASGMVWPCDPAERCLGGRFSNCAPGYATDFCTQCADDYYEQNNVCVPCEPVGLLALLYGVQVRLRSERTARQGGP
jgi:hypothetical protein